jgi:pantoate--beta-alanine ligase
VAAARQQGRRVSLVPTMGALHAGHGHLIDAARVGTDYVVVSIFVNPIQFGPQEDFDKYPRTLEVDAEMCRQRGVDLVFAPAVQEMYPERQLTFVTVEEITSTLCGASRPGHFRGVATVVTKLFNIVQPDVAYFGQKDAQQAAVIRKMVRDLNFPLEIVVVPTARDEDGLALSSRNRYLTSEERRAAAVIPRALQGAEQLLRAGERRADRIRRYLRDTIAAEPLARIDYAEVVDADTMQPVERVTGKVLLAVAVYIGRTRLIDNLQYEG